MMNPFEILELQQSNREYFHRISRSTKTYIMAVMSHYEQSRAQKINIPLITTIFESHTII